MELTIAAVILVVIVCGAVFLFWQTGRTLLLSPEAFSVGDFLSGALLLVMGVEFVKLLAPPHRRRGGRRAAVHHRPADDRQPHRRGGDAAGRGPPWRGSSPSRSFCRPGKTRKKIGDRSEEIEVSESGGAGQTEIVPPAAEHISSYLLTSI